MTLHDLVTNWILSGSDANVGFRIFSDYAKPLPAILKMVKKDPLKHVSLVKVTLIKISGIKLGDLQIPQPKDNVNTRASTPIREDYPFLSKNNCPPELKILVADKITTFQNYVEAYENVCKASDIDQHLIAVSNLVDNFIKNRQIHNEFEYYKAHTRVLGKHPIFREYQNFRELRKLPAIDLARMKSNLESNIQRTKKLLNADPREELRAKREEALAKHQRKLAEIERLLS